MSNYQFQVKHFNFISRPSAWQAMQQQHARMAKISSDFQDASSSASSTMFGAIDDQVSGLATNAAQAALTRVQAEVQAKADASTKQLDDAQSLIDQTQTAVSNPATASTDTSSQPGTGTVLDTTV
jgi:hypothetical protein